MFDDEEAGGAGHLCRAGAGAGTIVQYGPGQKPHLLSIDTGPPQAPPGKWQPAAILY